MALTIAKIQEKILNKYEDKFRGSVNKPKLMRAFTDVDKDNDGFLSLTEFRGGLEALGGALSQQESDFLFAFWDTLAGQQEPQGAVEIGICVSDLLGSLPQYGTGFNSGADKPNYKGGQSNKPSMAGGIFGGGSYEADANNEQPTSHRHAMNYAAAPPQGTAQSSRPKGNQSSIEGGIFGDAAPSAPPPQPSNRANRSNQSSIQGGIFGEAPPQQAQQNRNRMNSNQSSIPGGIFG